MARRFHFLFQNTRNGRPVASNKNKSKFRRPEKGFYAQLAGTSRYESRSENLLRNAKPCVLIARQLLPARQIQGIPTQGTHPRGKRRPMQHCTPACLAAANMRVPVIHAPTARAARQGRTNRQAWPQNLFATCTWVQKARRLWFTPCSPSRYPSFRPSRPGHEQALSAAPSSARAKPPLPAFARRFCKVRP